MNSEGQSLHSILTRVLLLCMRYSTLAAWINSALAWGRWVVGLINYTIVLCLGPDLTVWRRDSCVIGRNERHRITGQSIIRCTDCELGLGALGEAWDLEACTCGSWEQSRKAIASLAYLRRKKSRLAKSRLAQSLWTVGYSTLRVLDCARTMVSERNTGVVLLT